WKGRGPLSVAGPADLSPSGHGFGLKLQMNHGKLIDRDLKFAPAAPNSGHHREAKIASGVEGKVAPKRAERRQKPSSGFRLRLRALFTINGQLTGLCDG
ncbi:MAG: hypothetical protein WBY12_04080, partial [Hyphomicrobium sp.]